MTDAAERDDAARLSALDVARSFIVQAPAGSGKTGLLIQRFLALLATVRQPETIVAMTFTKKAAGEILERVIEALRAANATGQPSEPHDALTWRLARKVLERDAALGWNLLEHPSRLRILTIDALCGALMRQAPLTVKMGASLRFVERAEAMYVQAAQEEISGADATSAPWRVLLDHLDNDAEHVVRLLADMLGKRDQWLRYLGTHDVSELRAALEQSFAIEIERELARVRALFPRGLGDRLLELARFAASNLTAETPAHAMAGFLTAHALPLVAVNALPLWRSLAEWMLTKSGGMRMKWTTKEGFPAKGLAYDSDPGERVARKQAMERLIVELDAVPDLAGALHRARRLPFPSFDDADWAFAAALLEVLPRVAARLRLEFAREGAIDFAEGTLAALSVLDTEVPSDLLLAIDMRISHLLIDEFQDTSLAQYQLVEGLTAGWEPGDGRTLFIVGDPMQSIYGFREANVGLFVTAQQQRRLGSVALEALTLTRNFRSRPALVEWVNEAFAGVMPVRDDPDRGAVTFNAAASTREAGSQEAVTLALFADMHREAQAVVAHIESALSAQMASVAVLVRKRTDLEAILPALRRSTIKFEALGLDRLSERPALLDLTSLTHALVQPADRLAWLATLRAPWCGLKLPDLVRIEQRVESLPELVAGTQGADALADLSPDGRDRLARFMDVVKPALARRGRVPLPALVRATWLALGGPACVAEPIDLAAADRFFALLATHASGGDVPKWSALVESLSDLHVEPGVADASGVQIMTLHRAKGLEFDVVIMPGLARPPRSANDQLLLWRDRPWGLLLAPLKARTPGADKSPLYTYLRTLAADRDAAELGRLLYVGCTRARERLHLTACAAIDGKQGEAPRWKRPSRGTSLATLWPAIVSEMPPPPPSTLPPATAIARAGIALRRLSLDWRLPSLPPAISAPRTIDVIEQHERVVFDWARESARQVGIAAHRLLRSIGDDGLERWDESRIDALLPRIEREFVTLGFTAEEARASAALVAQGASATLADPRGRWLFDTAHADAGSEVALTCERDGAIVRVVLDRTFVDAKGTRWIVDFKLSRHEGADREGFLDGERERYRQQLEDYARVVGGIDARPVRVALYFPLLRGWREWAPLA